VPMKALFITIGADVPWQNKQVVGMPAATS